MPDPRKPDPDPDIPPVPGRDPRPINEPDPDRMPDEEPNPNPDETREPPLQGAATPPRPVPDPLPPVPPGPMPDPGGPSPIPTRCRAILIALPLIQIHTKQIARPVSETSRMSPVGVVAQIACFGAEHLGIAEFRGGASNLSLRANSCQIGTGDDAGHKSCAA